MSCPLSSDANGFTAASGIREGHQEAQLARARLRRRGPARLGPRLGTIAGASGYYATSGNSLRATVGSVPVAIVEVDARTRLGGFSARAEVAALFIGDAAALNTALMDAGNMEGPVSSQLRGGYVEAGYDVLRLLLPGTGQALTPFARYDYVDTQAAVPAGFTAQPALRHQALTAGLVYRPIFEIALTLDYRRHVYGEGPAANELASALTWMF